MLENIIAAILTSLRPSSRRNYSYVIDDWSAYTGGNWDVKHDKALTYLAAVARRRGQRNRSPGGLSTLAGATIRHYAVVLRHIYRHLVDAGVFEQNPFAHPLVRAPSPKWNQKRPTEIVQFDEVQALLDTPSAVTYDGIRDRAFLAVLFGGALRIGEARKLTLGDVRIENEGMLWLMLRATKTGKDFKQPLPVWAAERIVVLVSQRKAQGAESGDNLFMHKRKVLSATYAFRLFKKICAQAGLPKTISPHSARATAISLLIKQGIPYRIVQEFSRHSSVTQVEVYDKRFVTPHEIAKIAPFYGQKK